VTRIHCWEHQLNLMMYACVALSRNGPFDSGYCRGCGASVSERGSGLRGSGLRFDSPAALQAALDATAGRGGG
jgi:hypothetical protein